MTPSTKSVINKILVGMRINNQLFPDNLYFYDPFKESEFKGITDELQAYAFIQPVGVDATVTPDTKRGSSYVWYRQQFKLILSCNNCKIENLLAFGLNALRVSSARFIRATCETERIYAEETGTELTCEMQLVRIVFSVSSPINCSSGCVLLCQEPDC